MSQSTNEVTTGHVYDGIQEYDNPLPGWWTLLFYATIIYSCGYYFLSLIRPDLLHPEQRYELAVTRDLERQFAELGEIHPDHATLLSFIEDPEKEKWLKVGRAIFMTNCVSCHGRDGSGVSGPNMTDDHFLKVKTLADIPVTIINGSVSAGMPAWSTRLGNNEIVLVSAYVASLRGQNLTSARGSEGEVIPPWNQTD